VDYLIKPIDLSELKAALDRITRQPDEEERLSDMAGNGNLTSRERTILSGMLAGKSSKEIALDLCLSTHTVDTFRRRILKKTGAKNTVDLVHRFATSS
jgi:DNA-binding NarL/FixJ family response regulator